MQIYIADESTMFQYLIECDGIGNTTERYVTALDNIRCTDTFPCPLHHEFATLIRQHSRSTDSLKNTTQ